MKKYVLLMIIVLPSFVIHSQESTGEFRKLWIDAGFGAYSSQKTDGFSFGVSINYLKEKFIFKPHFIYSQEYQILGPQPLEEFIDLGIKAGKGFSWKYFQVYFSAGPGILQGTLRGKYLYTETDPGWFTIANPQHYESIDFFTPSLPLEIDIQLVPAKFLGLGLSIYENLNFKRPLFGFIVKAGIGKYR